MTPLGKKLAIAFLAAAALTLKLGYDYGAREIESLKAPPETNSTALTLQAIDDIYKGVCAEAKNQQLRQCGEVLALNVLHFTEEVEKRIYAAAPLKLDQLLEEDKPAPADEKSTEPTTAMKVELQSQWRELACIGLKYAGTLAELENASRDCLDTAIRVADYFKADESKDLSRVAAKLKEKIHNAAQKEFSRQMTII